MLGGNTRRVQTDGGLSMIFSCTCSSAMSSSISVDTVPLDVTGEGPTISLAGLMRWIEEGRRDVGRSEFESDPAEDLRIRNRRHQRACK